MVTKYLVYKKCFIDHGSYRIKYYMGRVYDTIDSYEVGRNVWSWDRIAAKKYIAFPTDVPKGAKVFNIIEKKIEKRFI